MPFGQKALSTIFLMYTTYNMIYAGSVNHYMCRTFLDENELKTRQFLCNE